MPKRLRYHLLAICARLACNRAWFSSHPPKAYTFFSFSPCLCTTTALVLTALFVFSVFHSTSVTVPNSICHTALRRLLPVPFFRKTTVYDKCLSCSSRRGSPESKPLS